MIRLSRIIFILVVFLATACKTSKLARPMEKYDERFEEKLSILNIPLKISLKELERAVNQQLDGLLYEDDTMDDGDNMMVKAEKKDDISLRIDSQMVKYRVPLSLWIKYDAGISKLEADGEIALDFKTAFEIKEDWSIQTLTELEGYEWIKKPKLRMGIVSLPIGFVGNIVLNKSKELISASIDEAVAKNLDFRTLMEDTWSKMFVPLAVAPEYNTWLTVNPQNIGMTVLRMESDTIKSTVVVESRPKIKLGEKPDSLHAPPLPPFSYRDHLQDDFVVHLNTEISYKEAERLAQDQLLGETFGQGKHSVTIEDIELYGQGNKLVVNTRLSGSYEGNIYMLGKPHYNSKRNTIDIKELKFTLETRNFLLKTAAWLLKSTMKKRIQENMNFLLKENLADIQSQLQEQLDNYQITDRVLLNGELQEFKIQNAYLAPESIRVDIVLEGKLKVEINGLN